MAFSEICMNNLETGIAIYCDSWKKEVSELGLKNEDRCCSLWILEKSCTCPKPLVTKV